jgi:hypothetical protein
VAALDAVRSSLAARRREQEKDGAEHGEKAKPRRRDEQQK